MTKKNIKFSQGTCELELGVPQTKQNKKGFKELHY